MDAAIFLDRDNTLIHNDGDLGDPEGVVLIQGVASAVASLRGLGFRIVTVSNQGGVARGKFLESDVDAVNRRINEMIHSMTGASIDRFYYCPYHPDGTVEKYRREHPWRKPQPGMILQAAKDMKLELSQSWTVGDALRDIEAGAQAGTRTILLSNNHAQPADEDGVKPDYIADSLVEAVRIIAQQRTREGIATTATMEGRKMETPTVTPSRSTRPTKPAQSPRPVEVDTLTEEPAAPVVPLIPAAPATAPELPTPTEPVHDELHDETHHEIPDERQVEEAQHEHPVITPAKRPARADGDATATALRQILQEMRDQREMGSEFSYTTMLAIVLQMLAAVFLLASFYFGWDNQDQFIRWMGAAILIQMTTIAMLLFGR